MLVELSNNAIENLESIHSYISEDSLHYADEFINYIMNEIRILEQFPRAGRIVPEYQDKSVRELIRKEYRIIYETAGDTTILILAVCHSSRLLGNVFPADTYS
jgi:plasmid stabilization system protein ParE